MSGDFFAKALLGDGYEVHRFVSCRGCGKRYRPGERDWCNHFYCSARCCDKRRAELEPENYDDDE